MYGVSMPPQRYDYFALLQQRHNYITVTPDCNLTADGHSHHSELAVAAMHTPFHPAHSGLRYQHVMQHMQHHMLHHVNEQWPSTKDGFLRRSLAATREWVSEHSR